MRQSWVAVRDWLVELERQSRLPVRQSLEPGEEEERGREGGREGGRRRDIRENPMSISQISDTLFLGHTNGGILVLRLMY